MGVKQSKNNYIVFLRTLTKIGSRVIQDYVYVRGAVRMLRVKPLSERIDHRVNFDSIDWLKGALDEARSLLVTRLQS